MAAGVGTAWGANIAPLISAGVALNLVECIDLTSATASVGSDSTVHNSSRGGSANVLGAATCISFKLNRRYRGGHPRNYWPAPSGADLSDSNTWTGAFVTAAHAGAVAFFAAVEALHGAWATTLDHVNVSYFHGFTNVTFPSGRTRPVPTLRGAPVVDDVVAYRVNPQVASQRRRNQTP
jgi:hypothetical protein